MLAIKPHGRFVWPWKKHRKALFFFSLCQVAVLLTDFGGSCGAFQIVWLSESAGHLQLWSETGWQVIPTTVALPW